MIRRHFWMSSDQVVPRLASQTFVLLFEAEASQKEMRYLVSIEVH